MEVSVGYTALGYYNISLSKIHADQLTARWSTFPYSPEELSSLLDLVKNVNCKR
jgi:hypothetical protein